MKTIYQIFILAFLIISFPCFSQNTTEIKEGEIISVDINGNMLNTNIPPEYSTKQTPPMVNASSEKNSVFNDDGTLKIPGYAPTGIQSADEANYKQAKLLLYQNNPQEYEKWFGKKNNNVKIKVRVEEFQKMPEIKQQQILANPDKYYLEDTNTNPVNDN